MDPRKDEASDEGEAFLPGSRSSEDGLGSSSESHHGPRRTTCYLRLLLEIAMAATIVFFLVSKPYCGRDTIRRTPVPRLPRKIYTFHNDPQYANEDMWFNRTDTLHTLHKWIPFSSAARGYVVIKDASRYDLPEPYTVPIDRFNDGPGYMTSVFHQLHCLSYLAEHYQQGYDGVELTKEVAHHTAHCFNYLRQGIMCAADTTLEGKTGAGPGEGSEHECTDYDALLEWANTHSAMKWRDLLPDDSTL